MSNENLHQSHQQQMSQNDCTKLLDNLFQREQSVKYVDEAFRLFEANFRTQSYLINLLIDYYFEHGSNAFLKQKLENLNEYSFSAHELFYTESSKTIIDLLLRIPDDLSNKVFDKIADKLAIVPTGSSSANLSSSILSNVLKLIDKSLYLLVLISYRKKAWISKLASHNLFNVLVKILKVNTNLNEIILVQTSLLFVSLMHAAPVQILNQHLDNVFQIFICLFKYLTYLEQQKSVNDGINIRNVRWSVRLYFYVCYGLFASQFLQFLRKKDQHLINKEFITSIFFYLRLHPALLKEKVDIERQLKQITEDISLEWRQYCLDPLCTNYNQCIQKLLKSSPITNIGANLNNNQSPANKLPSQLTILNEQQHSMNYLSHDQSYLTVPLSPSYIFAANNKTTFDYDNSSKRNSHVSVQASVPSTPTPGFNSQTAFQFPTFDYLSFDSSNQQSNKCPFEPNNINKHSIKNLTTHFMMHESETELSSAQTHVNCSNLLRKKSLSETNLYFDFDAHISKVSKLNANDQNNDLNLESARNKQVKSEMRDKNIKEPTSSLTSASSTQKHNVSTTDSSTNTCEDDPCLSGQTSINMAKINSIESNDIISGYFLGLNQNSETTINQNALIAKLKQEINHLVLQLVYERHLRIKYEEDSNRLHFIKTERDQLNVEKKYLERNLKQLVEQYKTEVEECLNLQNKSEVKAFKIELDEKNEFIEKLQNILEKSQKDLDEMRQKYEDIKKENTKLENEYAKTMQLLEKERNLKTKNEVDQNYTKSLRYTTDLLRKKLLLMSKTQQNLVQTFNQELSELTTIYNGQNNPQIESLINMSKSIEPSLHPLTPLYQFQQQTIEIQENEIESLKVSYNKLLAKFNDHELELDSLNKTLTLKNIKIEELNQTLDMDVVDMKAELLKSHHRIQSSIMSVNKRLEEEILKLKSNLNEQTIRNQQLIEQIESMKASELELKQLKLNSLIFATESLATVQTNTNAPDRLETLK